VEDEDVGEPRQFRELRGEYAHNTHVSCTACAICAARAALLRTRGFASSTFWSRASEEMFFLGGAVGDVFRQHRCGLGLVTLCAGLCGVEWAVATFVLMLLGMERVDILSERESGYVGSDEERTRAVRLGLVIYCWHAVLCCTLRCTYLEVC
jgi:hypothetical protein